MFGQDAGLRVLADDRIRAAAFTGSLRAGRLLADVAAGRPRPIPFYGELGSLNPVFVLPSGLGSLEAAAALATGYVTSMSGSAGQLCTKPGLLFVPTGHDLAPSLVRATAEVGEHRLLHPGITSGYTRQRDALAAAGLRELVPGSLRVDEAGHAWARPALLAVTLEEVLADVTLARDVLLRECFGPLSIVVEYEPGTDLAAAAALLLEGNLSGTVHAAPDDTTAQLTELVGWLTASVGRVVFGGWPTGVAVTPAMQHGGPWPATTTDATSVGTASIGRFLRGVAFQKTPQHLLPPPLQDANPWDVPQRATSPAGTSARWGTLTGR